MTATRRSAIRTRTTDVAQDSGPLRIGDLDTVVLCGGRGSRLKPLTDRLPKPMVHFQGKPMLDHIIDLLRAKGLRRFTLCVGYKGHVIRDHFAAPLPDAEMRFSDAGEDASMLQRLAAAAGLVGKRFLCVYGDTFIDLDVEKMAQQHDSQAAAVTIVTSRVQSPFGLVRTDERNWITSFDEKPLMTYYIGCFLADRDVFRRPSPHLLGLPDGQGLVALFNELAGDRRLAAYDHSGLQLSFNTATEHQQVEQELGRYYTVREERE